MTRSLLLSLSLMLTTQAWAQVEEIHAPPDAQPAPPTAQPPAAPPPVAPAATPQPGYPPAQQPGYQPGYQQPAPPPRPMLRTRYSRYRTAWYIGFGLGGGGGWVSDEDGDRSESEGGVGVLLKVGWVARPWLLLGFEASAWRRDNEDYAVQFNHYDLMATLFPIHDVGLYGKLGVGGGVALIESKVVNGYQVEGQTRAGADLKLGVGYEWQLMSAFNLGLDLSYGLTAYEEGRTHDLTLQLTCTWY